MAKAKADSIRRARSAEAMYQAIQDVQLCSTLQDETADIFRDCVEELLAHRQSMEEFRNFVTVQAAKMARY